MTCSTAGQNKSYIEVPNVFVSPSSGQFHCDQFYWDSYFIILGLVESKDYVDVARGMVDNLTYLFSQYNLVPMRNRTYDTGISQPPLLTSMARVVYEKTKDKKWLTKTMKVAETELQSYWMNSDNNDQTTDHMVFEGLSRYADHHLINQTAEHESGWDMTTRFNNQALDHIPVDLNSLLYKYEDDLEWFYKLTNKPDQVRFYRHQKKLRKAAITKYLFNEKRGFFFDYNYQTNSQSKFFSLAGFLPMWAGLCTDEQARRVVKNLKKFEFSGGLASTTRKNLFKPFRQWDYPNGWAPLQWFVISGLSRYGFDSDAERIAFKWLNLNLDVFKQTGAFWEKYDVVRQTIGQAGRYPTQSGFGWTNGVFLALLKRHAKHQSM